MRMEKRAASVQNPDIRQIGVNPKLDQIMPPRNAPATLPTPVTAKKAAIVDALNSGTSSVDRLMAVTMANSKKKKTRKRPVITYAKPIFRTGKRKYAPAQRDTPIMIDFFNPILSANKIVNPSPRISESPIKTVPKPMAIRERL